MCFKQKYILDIYETIINIVKIDLWSKLMEGYQSTSNKILWIKHIPLKTSIIDICNKTILYLNNIPFMIL